MCYLFWEISYGGIEYQISHTWVDDPRQQGILVFHTNRRDDRIHRLHIHEEPMNIWWHGRFVGVPSSSLHTWRAPRIHGSGHEGHPTGIGSQLLNSHVKVILRREGTSHSGSLQNDARIGIALGTYLINDTGKYFGHE